MQAMDRNLAAAQDLLNDARRILEDASADKADQIAKMLILDVRTRWSSTHVMLRKYIIVQLMQPTYADSLQAVHFYTRKKSIAL
jgi:hypothetical protein